MTFVRTEAQQDGPRLTQKETDALMFDSRELCQRDSDRGQRLPLPLRVSRRIHEHVRGVISPGRRLAQQTSDSLGAERLQSQTTPDLISPSVKSGQEGQHDLPDSILLTVSQSSD